MKRIASTSTTSGSLRDSAGLSVCGTDTWKPGVSSAVYNRSIVWELPPWPAARIELGRSACARRLCRLQLESPCNSSAEEPSRVDSKTASEARATHRTTFCPPEAGRGACAPVDTAPAPLLAGTTDCERACQSTRVGEVRAHHGWLSGRVRASSAEYERAPDATASRVWRCARAKASLHDVYEGTGCETLWPRGQGRRAWRHEDASRSARSSISSLPS